MTDGEEGLRVLDVMEKAEKKGPSVSASDFKKENYFLHPSSFVDENVSVGDGTKIWHYSHILNNTKIGKHCVLGQNVAAGPDVEIGAGCKIQNNVSLYKGVVLEDGVFCGPSCVFTNVYTPRAFIERKNEFLTTRIKKGASLGANSTIVCGVTVGRYAFVGAGAVVKKDVVDYALIVGVPARQIGWVCKCGVTLKFNKKNHARCERCGSEYKCSGKKINEVEGS